MSLSNLKKWIANELAPATPRKQPQASLQVESLEAREVMTVGMSLTSGVLTITGDSWNNNAYVSKINGKMNVRVESTPSSGFILAPEVKIGNYTGVKEIRFFGNGGDDTFDSTFIYPCLLDGGSGDDVLEGGGGDDTIIGGSGDDVLRGVGGNDNLYGGGGNDKLYGGSGMDGLYGGAGADELWGGEGVDRFLVMSGSSEAKDAVAHDAVIRFRNDVRTWQASEIQAMDNGLRQLHLRTGNDNLLETYSGGSVTFVRGDTNDYYAGMNHGNGEITLYDRAFTDDSRTALVTIHELAHNFDAEHSKWTAWKGLSGWTQTAPTGANASKYSARTEDGWYYLKSAQASFTRPYGATNPQDDFGTAWESYFTYKNGIGNFYNATRLTSAKLKHLDAFFNSMK